MKYPGYQAAEKLATNVILSGAKNLGASKINMLRDSSSLAAPQNDIFSHFSPFLDSGHPPQEDS
jgi:hypothetical protein